MPTRIVSATVEMSDGGEKYYQRKPEYQPAMSAQQIAATSNGHRQPGDDQAAKDDE
ncbi:hypothetical protein NIM87_18240 [Devosia sp. XJ19-1]|uniref:Uncharacterized protein n=1 Tax=Devosia ureilytica TaxID=2952754 RepID=A0A9Q4ARS1_9HYPH|nr:hypothetical protein [Devosia ureilytica]MCP8885450.1 hypothetical protein [Devosia ureilytica]MCP8889002.1 hypothetical protein [Devosia ureilytica]